MSEKTYTVKLTNAQRAMLRALCVKEAERLGYGTTYHDDIYSGGQQPGGRREWPTRLKKLSVVARKLMP